MTTVYHGTPLTPRAALLDLAPGRAFCVSFYAPRDVEAVEALSPAVMFRPWRLLILDGGKACWPRMGRGRSAGVVAGILSMAGTPPVSARSLGNRTGQSGGAVTDQRRTSKRQSLRSIEDVACLPHGRPDRALGAALRSVRSCLSRMDRRSEARAGRMRRLSPEDGPNRSVPRQHMASASHATRHRSRPRLSVHIGGQHFPRTEWMALRHGL